MSERTDDLILLTAEPIDVAAATKFVAAPAAGGINVFLGATRAEGEAGRSLVALVYEAYPSMAQRLCWTIVAEARGRWPIVRCAVVHRVGRVVVREPSVLIAVACPHRAEAFEACRYVIDEVKTRVPIWKQSIWSDGTATWPQGRRAGGN